MATAKEDHRGRYNSPRIPRRDIFEILVFHFTCEQSTLRGNPEGEYIRVRTSYEQWIWAGVNRRLRPLS